MKGFSLFVLALVFLSGTLFVSAQKKSKPPVKKASGRTISKSAPKIEIENWKEFEARELSLKLIFPKEPSISVSTIEEAGIKVRSSVIQSYINSDFYMVEVREYPEGIIPDGTDLGTDYGAWLKRFVLSRTKINSEKTFDYGQYKMVEFVYQQIGNEVLIHRVMVVGRRLYQVIVQFEIKTPDTLEQTIEKNKGRIDKFFLSFELTDERFVS